MTPALVRAVAHRVFPASDPNQEALSVGWRLQLVKMAPESFAITHSEAPNTAEPISDAPEFVIGKPFDPTCLDGTHRRTVPLQTKVVRCTTNARIIGWRAVLADENSLYLGQPIKNVADLERVASLDRGQEGFSAHVSQDQTISVLFSNPVERESVSEEALFLMTLEPANYGSFIFRFLPRLLLARELDIEPTLLVVPERKPWIVEAIAVAGYGHLPVMTVAESAGFIFKKLILIDDINFGDSFIDPQSHQRIRVLAASLRNASASSQNYSRLYVSRRLAGMMQPKYRRLVNEAEIEAAVVKLGFRLISPEMHTFSAQVSIFAHATHVVGPSGSGMLNAVFAEPGGSVVDIESYHVTVRQHARIYSSTGKRYGFVFGSFDGGRPESDPVTSPWIASASDVQQAILRFL